jgi:toxin HigB-1
MKHSRDSDWPNCTPPPSLDALGRLNSVGLHKLKGNLRNFWSIDVNGPWRILFKFKDGDAHEVHIADTH